MEALARKSELRAELAALMMRSDDLLLGLQTGRERIVAILYESQSPKTFALERDE